jgi:hypothetical protein
MSFVGPSYHLNHRKADVQRAVNLMPVAHEVGGGKSVAYLDSVPGLRTFSTAGAATGALLTEGGGFLLLESGGKILLDAA